MPLVPLYAAPVVYKYSDIQAVLDANFNVTTVGVLREVYLVGHRDHYRRKTKAEHGKTKAISLTVQGINPGSPQIPMDIWISVGEHLTLAQADELLDWANRRLSKGAR